MANTNDIARSTYDQSEILSEIGFFKTLFKLWEKGRQHCIHAIVTDGQDKDGMYEVQPLTNSMKQLKDRKEGVVRPKIRVWPLLFRHGGYRIEAYPVVGDTGYVIACDRNGNLAIDANGKENPADNEGPKDIEVFDSCKYEYGFFIPSSWVKPDPLLFDPLKQDDNPYRAKFVRDMREKMVIGNDRDWSDNRSAYISIDKEGNIVIHCKKFRLEEGVDVAELYDTEVVVGYYPEINSLKTWRCKILRTGGVEGEPIPLKGSGGSFDDRFIFPIKSISLSSTSVKIVIGDGAVQIGGFTHFVSGKSLNIPYSEVLIYGELDLTSRSFDIGFTSRGELTLLQDDFEKFTFPLYLFEKGTVKADYRVMIGCGTWELGRYV